MKHRHLIFMFLCVSLYYGYTSICNAQVIVEASLDSSQIYIGQRTGINVEVSVDADCYVTFPEYDSLYQIVEGIEVLSSTVPDTQLLNDGKRLFLKKKYIITAFDSALYFIPPFQIKVDTTNYKSKSLALKVYTVDVDTTKLDSIYGMHPEMKPPFESSDWFLPVGFSVLITILVLILLYLCVRLKSNKPIRIRLHGVLRLAPHQKAMAQIEQIRLENLSHSEDVKEYYTKLTDVLRQYIGERFGFNATEMTSSEIIHQLSQINDLQAIDELRNLLNTSDLVKFAKQNTELSENDKNLLVAADYINQTKRDVEMEPQSEDVILERASAKTRLVLKCSIVTLCVILLVVILYLIYKIILLLIV